MQYPITITGRHIEITEPLRDYITEKIGRACKLLDKITTAHVTVAVEKHRHIVEVVIHAHGATLHGKEETHDMYSSIDQVLDKIEIQAKRLKEKIKDHKHQVEGAEAGAVADEEPAQARPKVFVAETFAPKPLSVDEAVEDLQARVDAFLVFFNANNGLVNVLYKRGDGTFGLVQPPA
jgi:putative sigma-54 modulation protein